MSSETTRIRRIVKYKCPFCEKKMERAPLIAHVSNRHEDELPEGFSPLRYVFHYVNKKPLSYHGICTECKGPTPWDENKGRYDRQCEKQACHDRYVAKFEDNMRRKRGVTRISSTAEGQEKMLANRKISGKYKWSDGTEKTYTGKYELHTLEFMDKVMHLNSKDVFCPGPILEYVYEGKKHLYITDFYYQPYDLIIEVKDGGSNPNKRNMPEYRAKQIAKEKYIIDNTDFNYIRLTNDSLDQLLAVFMDLKMQLVDDSKDRVIHVNEGVIVEADTNLFKNVIDDPEITGVYPFRSSDGIYNVNVTIKGFNKYLRGRSEMLIVDKDKVFLNKNSKGYSIPGGGWEENEDHNLSAIRETNEEARIKVKNVSYVSKYAALFDPKDWVREKISKENWWCGEYIELYIGEYDGTFKGKVEKIDQQKDMEEKGKFYKIKDVYKDLIPQHQKALSDFVNESYIEESSFMEHMNALLTGFVPGIDSKGSVMVSAPNMQNTVFAGNSYYDDDFWIIKNNRFDEVIHRNKSGILVRESREAVCRSGRKVYIVNNADYNKISEIVCENLGKEVSSTFLYETVFGHKGCPCDVIFEDVTETLREGLIEILLKESFGNLLENDSIEFPIEKVEQLGIVEHTTYLDGKESISYNGIKFTKDGKITKEDVFYKFLKLLAEGNING